MATAAVPIIGSVLGGLLGFGSAGRAGKAIANANIAAEHGVIDATGQGQQGVQNVVNAASANIPGAGESAKGQVLAATQDANNTLQAGLNGQTGNLAPYLSAGATGASGLEAYAKSNPTFKFAPTQAELENTPGYKFQLAQGTQAINNSASAGGLVSSGNTLAALQNYGQGLAGTYYQNAFKNAQDTFQTNQNSTLANLSTLAGIGLSGSGQFNQATQNASNQQAKNTLGAGYFSGGTDIDLQKYLTGLGLQGSEFNANLGLTGSKMAGDYAVGAGGGTAAGIQGGTNSLLGGLQGVMNAIPPSWLPGGGSTTSLPNPATNGGYAGYTGSPLSGYATIPPYAA